MGENGAAWREEECVLRGKVKISQMLTDEKLVILLYFQEMRDSEPVAGV